MSTVKKLNDPVLHRDSLSKDPIETQDVVTTH